MSAVGRELWLIKTSIDSFSFSNGESLKGFDQNIAFIGIVFRYRNRNGFKRNQLVEYDTSSGDI